MQNSWKYKSLGDIAIITMGQSPSSDTYNDSEGLPFFQGNADFGKEHPMVRVYCNAPIRIADNNDILISVRAPIGAINIADRECCIGRGLASIRGEEGFLNRFLYYFLLASKKVLLAQGTGSTFKSIGKDALKNLVVPDLPISEQERIVAELDLLTGIIDKQKAQLKELDTLAQSIFYDMFGDPVENEKGWEMYEIASVCDDLFAGGDKPKDFSEEKDDDYKYPIIGNGDGERGILGYSKSYRVGKAAVTIGARGASIGNCRICEPHFTPVVRLITLVPNKRVNLGYLYAISRKLSFNVNGAGQAQLTTPNVANKLIPVPPRELQDSFAQKIQSIESQKASINQSIAETQKLFDYTMDKYFG